MPAIKVVLPVRLIGMIDVMLYVAEKTVDVPVVGHPITVAVYFAGIRFSGTTSDVEWDELVGGLTLHLPERVLRFRELHPREEDQRLAHALIGQTEGDRQVDGWTVRLVERLDA